MGPQTRSPVRLVAAGVWALAALAAPASAQLGAASSARQVFVVDDDGGPGVDFDDLGLAVETAPSGAVLLVRSGTYPSSFIVDRPVSLIADEGALVVTAGFSIRNTSPGEVVLHGLDIGPAFGALGITVDALGVSGPLLIQECTLRGGGGVTHIGGGPGLSAIDCASVTLVDCNVTGGDLENGEPAPAVYASNSVLGLFESELAGNVGDPGVFIGSPEEGAAGLVALGSLVFCQGTVIRGGAGGDAGSACDGGDGGDGVVLGATSELRYLDCTFTGGPGGIPQAGCSPGAEGAGIDPGTATVLQHAGTARTLEVETVLREQQVGTLTVTGQPGDLVVLGLGYDLVGQRFLPPFAAPLSIAFPPPGLQLNLGTVPAGGILSQSFSLGHLPPGLGFTLLPFQLQPIVFDGAGVFLANTRRLVFLNSRY